jgi:hypothetical protein
MENSAAMRRKRFQRESGVLINDSHYKQAVRGTEVVAGGGRIDMAKAKMSNEGIFVFFPSLSTKRAEGIRQAPSSSSTSSPTREWRVGSPWMGWDEGLERNDPSVHRERSPVRGRRYTHASYTHGANKFPNSIIRTRV